MTIVTRYDRDMNPKLKTLESAAKNYQLPIKVLRSIEKKGYYSMPEKRKKEISKAWEKAQPGTGFYGKKTDK